MVRHAHGHSRPRSLACHRGAVLRRADGGPRRRRDQARAAGARRRPAQSSGLGADERVLRGDEPEQARHRGGSAAARGRAPRLRAGAARRRARRELLARRDRAARARLCGGPRGQSRHRLRVDHRLRPDGPARPEGGLQHDRPGHERAHGADGHARASADARGGIRVGRGGLLHGVRHDQCRARPPLPYRRRAAGGREPARLVARPFARPGGDLLRQRRAPEACGQPEPPPDARGGVSGPGWPREHRAAECGSVEALLRRARRRGDGDGPEIRHQ